MRLGRRSAMQVGTAALGFALAPAMAQTPPPFDLVYPRMPERPTTAYGYRLISLALDRAGVSYQLRVLSAEASALRAGRQMSEGAANVLDTGASQDQEIELDLVPFPLDMGLSGCRLLLVRRELEPKLARVRSLADLRAFSVGQGEGWTDARILRAAGFKVVETGQFLSLFRMLEAGRFDLLALGADEAHDLLSRHANLAPSAVVSREVALHYPFVRMYMIRRGQPGLATALLTGLQRAHEDGTLLRVLQEQPGLGPLLRGERQLPPTVISMPNPTAPQAYQRIAPRYLHPLVRDLLPQGRE